MVRIFLAALLSLVARAQRPDTPYPRMAPLDQYLIADRNAEVALARTAAPKAIFGQRGNQSADLLQSPGRAEIPPNPDRKNPLALVGKSETQMLDLINSALDKKELPSLEPGAMVPVGKWSDVPLIPTIENDTPAHFLRILSMAFPFASSSTSLSR